MLWPPLDPAKKIIHIIHTSFVAVQQLTGLFRGIMPDVVLRHKVGDSLLAEEIKNGGVTPVVTKRMEAYCTAAELGGAHLIFNLTKN